MKDLQNLYKTLNKAELKSINGQRGACSAWFICDPAGNGADGERCFLNGGVEGTMLNGQCCS